MVAPEAEQRIAASRAPIGRPPTVLFITSQFLPRRGGAEVITLREAVALRAAGVPVMIITPRLDQRWAPREEIDGVPVRRLGGLFVGQKLRLRFGGQWIAEARLWLELVRRRREYDVIHLRQLSYLARPAALASLLTRKPIIVRIASAGRGKRVGNASRAATTLHAGPLDPRASFLQVPASSWGRSDIESLRGWQWTAKLTLWLLGRSRATFLALSRRMHASLIEDGIRRNQIVLLPTGIDVVQYAPVAERVEARLLAWARGIDGAELPPPTVFCAGRYSYEKGPDILLQAWHRVHTQMPEARLLMAGGGPLSAQLDALAGALNIAGSVEMLGSRSDVPDLMARADVFVLPSRFEGLPNALLEAMASGLPCVATRVSGSEDMIVDGESGLLVPPEDPDALAEALVRLLTHPADALALGRAARARIVALYDREAQMQALVSLYTHLRCGGTAETWRPEQAEPDTAAHMAPRAPGARAGRPVGLVE